jgi:hypothetical protein
MSVLCVAQHEPHSARHMQVRRHRSVSNAYPALLISDFATVMKWLGLAASTGPTLEMPVMACSWICARLEGHENFHKIRDNACTLCIPIVRLSDQDEQQLLDNTHLFSRLCLCFGCWVCLGYLVQGRAHGRGSRFRDMRDEDEGASLDANTSPGCLCDPWSCLQLRYSAT